MTNDEAPNDEGMISAIVILASGVAAGYLFSPDPRLALEGSEDDDEDDFGTRCSFPQVSTKASQ